MVFTYKGCMNRNLTTGAYEVPAKKNVLEFKRLVLKNRQRIVNGIGLYWLVNGV